MYHTNPIDLESKPYTDVIRLYADVRTMQIREKNQSKKSSVMRVYASDDAGWW